MSGMNQETGKIQYTFSATLWKHNGPASWYFVSVPRETSKEIRQLFQKWEEGWGRLKCEVQIRETSWDTSIWYDSNHQAYILPIKAEVRRKEAIQVDQNINITISI